MFNVTEIVGHNSFFVPWGCDAPRVGRSIRSLDEIALALWQQIRARIRAQIRANLRAPILAPPKEIFGQIFGEIFGPFWEVFGPNL